MGRESQFWFYAAIAMQDIDDLWLVTVISNRIGREIFVAFAIEIPELGSSAGSADSALAVDDDAARLDDLLLQQRSQWENGRVG